MTTALALILMLAFVILCMTAGIHCDPSPATRLRLALIDAAAFTILVLAMGALL